MKLASMKIRQLVSAEGHPFSEILMQVEEPRNIDVFGRSYETVSYLSRTNHPISAGGHSEAVLWQAHLKRREHWR